VFAGYFDRGLVLSISQSYHSKTKNFVLGVATKADASTLRRGILAPNLSALLALVRCWYIIDSSEPTNECGESDGAGKCAGC
jgi:hypothetical protein